MALAEFEPGIEKVTSEVNGYLQRTWEIESFERLAPVVLLQRNIEDGSLLAYPLILGEDLRVGWEASAVREDPEIVKFVCSSLKGIRLAMGNDLESEWNFNGVEDEDFDTQDNGNGWDYYFAKKVSLLRSPVFALDVYFSVEDMIKHETSPELLFFGDLENRISHESVNVFLVDFRRSDGNYGFPEQMDVGEWLMDVVSRGEILAGNAVVGTR